jgi:hypothetical protein
MLMRPARLAYPDSWLGHIPFAAWLMNAHQPGTYVELGTHSGNSYLACCQAAQAARLDTRCYAVDTWAGDAHAGRYGNEVFEELSAYHARHYAAFSRLLRMTFDEARPHFAAGSVDLLHIDGLHTYEAVRHDFDSWLPTLSAHGIVLLHDTNVRERDFRVWQLWAELRTAYPAFEFDHSHGLGVLLVGPQQSPDVLSLLDAYREDPALVKALFAGLGQHVNMQFELDGQAKELQAARHSIAQLQHVVADREHVIQLMQHSRSWRMTAPLRRLHDLGAPGQGHR